METAGPFRIFEKFEGKGVAWSGEKRIADVRYSLKDAQEIDDSLQADAHGSRTDAQQARPGERSIFGLLRTLAAAELAGYAGTKLHLELEDGRLLPFTVAKHLDARSCLIQGAGRNRVNKAPVSVIIPAYNHARYILASVESALAQNPAPFEVIVVDDSSPDNTAEVLAPLIDAGRIRYIRQSNAGMAAARNTGARSAGCEFLYFLDDDDFMFAGALAPLLELLRQNPTAPMAYGDAVLFSDDEPPVVEVVRNDIELVDRKPFMLFNQLGSPGQVLMRRSAFVAAGSFDPDIWGTDDWDLWMRLLQGAPALYLRRPVLAYRMHANNASRNVARMYESSLRVARRHLLTFPDHERAILRRYSYLRLRRYHVPKLGSMFRNAAETHRWSMAGAAARAWLLAWLSEAAAYAQLKLHLVKQGRWSLQRDTPLSQLILQHCGRL